MLTVCVGVIITCSQWIPKGVKLSHFQKLNKINKIEYLSKYWKGNVLKAIE